MMPGTGPRHDERKKRALTAAFIGGGATMAYVVLSASRFSAWEWVPLAVGLAVITAIAVAGNAGRPGGRRRGGSLGGHGRDDDHGPAGAAAHRWRMLVMVSGMMPRSAGRRWLAEAQSLLSEIAAARRGAAVRSYLLSAPRLAVMMWAREVLRRARLGPRRPG
jgi:hypothetical protein